MIETRRSPGATSAGGSGTCGEGRDAALGLEDDGQASRWSQRALFVALTLTPLVFLLSIVWAWRHRDEMRAKSGAFGLFSLWFPLLTTLGGAWFIFGLVPKLFSRHPLPPHGEPST